ncbi:hypothetical protein [Desulfovibrio sp. JC022]|uniref:hypothetical protein n=1 Tax=Desulfovibrio sp. JC022 TaxID=2593642 RepID=UPI0013CF7427|nr:hypothetical protein [Desulfovibrio sp. JC022]NDV23355.1 hypothetical protein [Desulfovibrio sp. JC022]
MKILNLYGSLNGQTEKVALEIEKAAVQAGHNVSTVNLKKEGVLFDLLNYDFTFIGSGVYTWLPGKSVQDWINRQLAYAREKNLILPGSPRIPGKFACVYCTYAGPHTGEAEAVPAIKYMGQLFDHLGITVADEWSVIGAFVPEKMQHFNISGRLGNIEGRPNADDLKQVREKTIGLLGSLQSA